MRHYGRNAVSLLLVKELGGIGWIHRRETPTARRTDKDLNCRRAEFAAAFRRPMNAAGDADMTTERTGRSAIDRRPPR